MFLRPGNPSCEVHIFACWQRRDGATMVDFTYAFGDRQARALTSQAYALTEGSPDRKLMRAPTGSS